MIRKTRPAFPFQGALNRLESAVHVVLYFLAVCLCSASTAKTTAVLLVFLTLAAAFLFRAQLRDRLKPPILALALMVLMDGISCGYAVSGKFALNEFLKVLTAFCLALLLLAFTGEERPERKIAGILEGCAVMAGLTSIDLLSTRWISTPVLTVLGWFSPDYSNLSVVEEGVRMTSIFTSPNVFAGCVGIGVLLGLGLAISSEKPTERALHVICLSVNALSFILAFSMGACAAILPAFLIFFVLSRAGQRIGVLLLMVETFLVTALCAFLISLTSMTAWDGVRVIPLTAAVGGAAMLCLLDLQVGQRLAAKLAGHGKAVFSLTVALLAGAVIFVIEACSLTTGVTLSAGESLRRSVYPSPGSYSVTAEMDGDPNVTIESQSRTDSMMHTSSRLYRGPLSQAAFTVPEDSIVVWFQFNAKSEARLESVEYQGEDSSGGVPLDYQLLPGFIANRLQGLWANQNAIQRFVFFEDGLKLFQRSPVIGLGLGAFENGVRGVQTFRYDTKYAHNHYIQTLAETGIVGLTLFLLLLAVSALALWKGRKKPLAPALGAALAFMAGHALVEFVFSTYCYLPMAFGVFAAISLCCAGSFSLPSWMENATAKNGLLLSVCAVLVVFWALLWCNIAARRMVTGTIDLDRLEQAASLDPFEKADYMLTYVDWVTGAAIDEQTRQKADEYALRLGKINSNTIPFYLAKYYFDSGRVSLGFEMAERYVTYVSADKAVWQSTFYLLEQYEQDTETYRSGVTRIADLLDSWNEENMGHIALDERAQDFIARMRP